MVIIEQEPEPEPEITAPTVKNNNKNISTKSSKSGIDDDGFETASEGDVSDVDVESNEEHERKNHEDESELVVEEEQHREIDAPKEGSYEDALNDDQLQQKALEQANDAKLEGNKLFGDGMYEEALLQYELALQVAPEVDLANDIRSTCYSNRGICFMKLGKYDDTIKECTKALKLNPDYLKALIRRGEAHEKLEHYDEAIADMEAILKLDPGNVQYRRTIARLKPMADEKREKMKEEMIGKLKEMGNSVLGRFGMSVDNFKAVKDPNTGSYSLSFQR